MVCRCCCVWECVGGVVCFSVSVLLCVVVCQCYCGGSVSVLLCVVVCRCRCVW